MMLGLTPSATPGHPRPERLCLCPACEPAPALHLSPGLAGERGWWQQAGCPCCRGATPSQAYSGRRVGCCGQRATLGWVSCAPPLPPFSPSLPALSPACRPLPSSTLRSCSATPAAGHQPHLPPGVGQGARSVTLFSFLQPCLAHTPALMVPIVQVRKLELREVKRPTQRAQLGRGGAPPGLQPHPSFLSNLVW